MINNLNQSIRYSEFHVNMRYNLQQVHASVKGVLVPCFPENFFGKTLFLAIKLVSVKSKITHVSRSSDPLRNN